MKFVVHVSILLIIKLLKWIRSRVGGGNCAYGNNKSHQNTNKQFSRKSFSEQFRPVPQQTRRSGQSQWKLEKKIYFIFCLKERMQHKINKIIRNTWEMKTRMENKHRLESPTSDLVRSLPLIHHKRRKKPLFLFLCCSSSFGAAGQRGRC